ncbi:Holliday junction resolvase RecU [Aerococcus urinae]|uniref:Holliday junction resolvase RecU n=1 Tax=Aerococcus urinae TaxID=1376 RepID=UPI0025509757|nr:Holliday junction resolvase RecU [Aerococcus urinae]MDK7190817.1 Holliday junction resolvase RecU [Aerococcus urinae]MDK8390254.1 Holliday junction resolvase RecU [Aerococcus urinae]
MYYPNGKKYHKAPSLNKHSRRQPKTIYAKRGMLLEDMLNDSNAWYLSHDLAVIHKKPTPIQVVHVDYPNRQHAKITEAYYRQASTTDYNGVYQGRYIDFEAKQTKTKTRFPLNNFHDHQIKHMEKCSQQGGISFVILHFTTLSQSYLYPLSALLEDWQAFQEGQNASISLKRIKNHGYLIKIGYQPPLDYLAALDKYLQNNN